MQQIRQLMTRGQLGLSDTGRALPRWLAQARHECACAGVAGGLLFDGEGWLQLFEGPPAAVQSLLTLLQAAPDLGLQGVLLDRRRDGAAQAGERWLIGYVEPPLLAGVAAQADGPGADAVAAFIAALAACDAS
jgi:hypothetical protein